MVSIDEYAMRRGRVHRTVLVDVEPRRPVDLLPDHEAGTVAICRDRVQLTRFLLDFDHPRGRRVLSKDSFEVITGRVRVPDQGGCESRVTSLPEESPPHRPGRQVSGDVRQSRELLPQRGHVRSRLPTGLDNHKK
ncbi:hypothetical protein ACIGW4_29210 [Streptomyces sp. NPDC053513]|uniref:hypothetical protein n=1 Tax=unclassified Streptomyces TaxID=2593676 RepID=UPI0037CDF251